MFERRKATLRSGCGSWLSVADWFPAVAVTVGRCGARHGLMHTHSAHCGSSHNIMLKLKLSMDR